MQESVDRSNLLSVHIGDIGIRKHFEEEFRKNLEHKDLANGELILPPLSRFFRERYIGKVPSLIIDAGANIGETSAILLGLFSSINCIRHYLMYSGLSPAAAQHAISRACPKISSRILAVEAQISNIRVLEKRGQAECWFEANWEVHHFGLSKEATINQTTTFFGSDRAGFQQGSLDARFSGGKSRPEVVRLKTIDMFLEDLNLTTNPVYLLKIDVEGFDGWVLQGAVETLKRQEVKFILFEYNASWRATDVSLKDIVEWLYSLRYHCFLIMPVSGLIPLYRQFWSEFYETWRWSNVFCGRESDQDVTAMFSFMSEVSAQDVMNEYKNGSPEPGGRREVLDEYIRRRRRCYGCGKDASSALHTDNIRT